MGGEGGLQLAHVCHRGGSLWRACAVVWLPQGLEPDLRTAYNFVCALGPRVCTLLQRFSSLGSQVGPQEHMRACVQPLEPRMLLPAKIDKARTSEQAPQNVGRHSLG